MWGWASWERFGQDLRHAFRVLRKSPMFAAAATLTLGLGIGANSAVFSLVDAVLLRPLPYPQASRLVHAQWRFPHDEVPSVTGLEFAFWNQHNFSFESAAALDLFPSGLNLLAGREPEHIKVLKVSRDFFRTLGVQPFLGGGFTPGEDAPRGPKTVILSYGLWQRRFASDPEIVGRAVSLESQSYLITGVMPRSFQFVLPWAVVHDVDAWVLLQMVADPRDQGHDYTMIARIKPNLSLDQAQADMARLLAEIRQNYPSHVAPTERGILLMPYQKWVTGDVRTPLLVLFGAVGLVLLIATVNVTNLVLARAVGRQSEVAVRFALGASRIRVIRQLLTENLLLAFLGGGVAMAAAQWTAKALVLLAPQSLPLTIKPQVDLRVLVFTFLLTAAAGVAAGLVPAFGASRLQPSQSIQRTARSVSGHLGHRRVRAFMVTGEVAISVLLLTGAMLLIISLVALQRVDTGFNPRNLSTFHLSFAAQRFKTAAATWVIQQRVLANLAGLPGVESAAVISALPLEPGLNGDVRVISAKYDTHVYVQKRSASPDYFKTMQIPVLQGRSFQASDTATAPLVVVVNEAFVQKCCAGRDILASQVALEQGLKGSLLRQIVGVVGDTREEAIAEPAPPMVFFPPAQVDDDLARGVFPNSSWVVRSRAPLAVRDVRYAVAQVDPAEAVANFSPMARLVAESVAPRQFVAILMIVFAGLAALLAVIGLYGVLSYSVAGRVHEIGLRMALGATRWDVLRMVLGEGARTAFLGVAIGLLAAFGLTRLLTAMLFGIGPRDPGTFAAIAILSFLVALTASYIPARRATRVDPMVALRHE